jgi:hypothetical protein
LAVVAGPHAGLEPYGRTLAERSGEPSARQAARIAGAAPAVLQPVRAGGRDLAPEDRLVAGELLMTIAAT